MKEPGTLISCGTNRAYSVEKYEYNNHRYLSISRMYKKAGNPEWLRGKGVSFPIDTDEDIDTIRRVMQGIKHELLGK